MQTAAPWTTGKGSAHIHWYALGAVDRGTERTSAGLRGNLAKEGEGLGEEGVAEGGRQQGGMWLEGRKQ